MTRPVQHCPGPVSRRSFLQVGSLGLGGLGLADLLRLKAQAAATRGTSQKDTSIIFVWLPGGPPHMETYDMKPDAPAEYRGQFRPISSVVPGMDFCELLPLHTKVADRFNLIRSVAHEFNGHDGGHKRFLTGRIPKSPQGFVNDAPAAGSIVAKVRESRSVGLPNYMSLPPMGRHGADVFSFGAAYLGSAYTPFAIPGDPSQANFEVRNLSLAEGMSDRLGDRGVLLSSLDKLRRAVDGSGAMEAMDKFNQQAYELLTNEKARQAFDLSREPEHVRERFGMHAWGQRALMARRLVEAGASFVTVVMENPYQSGVTRIKSGVYNWDSHAVNCHIYDDARVRFPIYDRTITAMVEDLFERGLDKKVMLIVTGEFGRTPRINPQIGTQTGVVQPGRDHWARAMSILITGGGMRTGQVIGSTNAKGEEPKDRPLTPNDLWATVYRHLGIDYENTSFLDFTGRPMPILPFGEPIEELLPASA